MSDKFAVIMETPHQHISLHDLLADVHRRLDEAFPLPVWVVAEVSELKVNYSGHCYLELIEKSDGERLPRAKCSAVIWRNIWGAIGSYFLSSTGRELGPGMKVLLRASAIFHEVYGFSLQVSDIDPAYTVGEMERQRQATIAHLQQDGVFEMNHTLDLPEVPQRVAVISSRNAAGYQDFMNELSSSPYRFETTLFDAFMQGEAAEASIISALELVAQQAERYDIVVLIRGGGATSDLAAFDSYRLCSHLAQFPLPVVTGIGHDKDQSVADMVAAVALKTPTAVARWLVDSLAEFDASLQEIVEKLGVLVEEILDGEKEMLSAISLNLQILVTTFARRIEARLGLFSASLPRYAEMAAIKLSAHLDTLASGMASALSGTFSAAWRRIENAQAAVVGYDPQRILALGFALVRDGSGRVLKDPASLTAGDKIDVSLAKGGLQATVDQTYGKK